MDAEVGERAAEEDGRLPPGQELRVVEALRGRIEQGQLLERSSPTVVRDAGRDRVRDWEAALRACGSAVRGSLEADELAPLPVDHACELVPVADGPGQRHGDEPESCCKLVEELE